MPSDFRARIDQFVAEAKAKAADGLSLAEVSQLFVTLIHVCVEMAAGLSNAGAEKKLFALEAVGALFDTIYPAIPLPFFAAPFRPLLRSWLRACVLHQADGAIEAIYHRVAA